MVHFQKLLELEQFNYRGSFLSPILRVPNLDCNMISMSKLTCDLNCVTKFYPNFCEFQAMDLGKVIGNVELVVDSICSKKVLHFIQRFLLEVMFFNLFSILCQFQMKMKLCNGIFVLVIQTLCILKSYFLISSTIEIPILIIVKSVNLPSKLDMYIQALRINLHIHFL